jgi:hypothetical protein
MSSCSCYWQLCKNAKSESTTFRSVWWWNTCLKWWRRSAQSSWQHATYSVITVSLKTPVDESFVTDLCCDPPACKCKFCSAINFAIPFSQKGLKSEAGHWSPRATWQALIGKITARDASLIRTSKLCRTTDAEFTLVKLLPTASGLHVSSSMKREGLCKCTIKLNRAPKNVGQWLANKCNRVLPA